MRVELQVGSPYEVKLFVLENVLLFGDTSVAAFLLIGNKLSPYLPG